MRTTKFRAEVKGTPNWVYGWYCEDYTGQGFIQTLDGVDTYGVKKNTVGEFTGIMDKNGVEIYEGDVYQNPESPGAWAKIVSYHNGAFCGGDTSDIKDCMPLGWMGDDEGYSEDCYPEKSFDWIEIIGNIHQNPEICQTA